MQAATTIFVWCLVIATANGQSIIGGTIAPDGHYPYTVALRFRERFFCGASIMNERWLLGAGHCALAAKKPQDVTALVGTNSLTDGSGTIYEIGLIIPHPNYSRRGTLKNDIALFQVVGAITMSKKIQPIKLPKDATKSYVGVTAYLAGWGVLQPNEAPPSELRHVKLTVISNVNCSFEWRLSKNWNVARSQLCTTGYLEKRMDTNGDSGSPLVANGEQIGLVSFSWDGLPDIHTRVSSYLAWIRNTISAN